MSFLLGVTILFGSVPGGGVDAGVATALLLKYTVVPFSSVMLALVLAPLLLLSTIAAGVCWRLRVRE